MKYQRRPNDAHNLPELKTFRTELRIRMTPAEAGFWNIVKGSQLNGKKFRRQYSVGRYILDFYCPSERIGIEPDGKSHIGTMAEIYDQERTWFLESFQIKIIRFQNKTVFENEEWIIHKISSCYGWKQRTTPSAEAAATPPL